MSATLPFGLRDVKIAPIDATGTIGTMVDLPNAQTFSFSESEDFETLRGDDGDVAVHGKGASVDWELDSGGIDLAAYAILAGGTVTTTGVAPATVNTYVKKGTDSRPYFWVEGQAISDSGGDFHVTLGKCKASDSLEGSLEDGSFWVTKASGTALSDAAGNLYTFKQNGTAVDIAQPA